MTTLCFDVYAYLGRRGNLSTNEEASVSVRNEETKAIRVLC